MLELKACLRLLLLLAVGGGLLGLSAQPVNADFTGIARGHAFVAQMTVGNTPYNVQRVDLPLGGVLNGDVNFNAVLHVTAGDATSSCSSQTMGATVSATCLSQVDNLVVGLGPIDLITADRLTAQSNSSDDDTGSVSDSTGSSFSNLCVRQNLVGSCYPVTQPESINVNIAGIVTGTVDIAVEALRTDDSGTAGNGLTFTWLKATFSVPGQGAVLISMVEADSFVGNVAQAPVSTTPSPTSTATATRSPTRTPIATKTPVATRTPAATRTPTPTITSTATLTPTVTGTVVVAGASTLTPTASPTSSATVLSALSEPTATSTPSGVVSQSVAGGGSGTSATTTPATGSPPPPAAPIDRALPTGLPFTGSGGATGPTAMNGLLLAIMSILGAGGFWLAYRRYSRTSR